MRNLRKLVVNQLLKNLTLKKVVNIMPMISKCKFLENNRAVCSLIHTVTNSHNNLKLVIEERFTIDKITFKIGLIGLQDINELNDYMIIIKIWEDDDKINIVYKSLSCNDVYLCEMIITEFISALKTLIEYSITKEYIEVLNQYSFP